MPAVNVRLSCVEGVWTVVLTADGQPQESFQFPDEQTARSGLVRALKAARRLKSEGTIERIEIHRERETAS